MHQPTSWKTDEALELMRSFDPDLCVMAYVTLLVPQRVLDAPRRGTIQYHPRCCRSIAARARSTGRSSRARPGPGSPSSGPTRPWTRVRSSAEGGRDRAGRHARQPVLQPPLPDGRRRHDGGGRPGARGQGAADPAGRQPGDLRELVQEGRRQDRLEQAGGRGVQPDPRHRPAARRLDPDRRPRGADLRQRAGPRVGPTGHRAGGG